MTDIFDKNMDRNTTNISSDLCDDNDTITLLTADGQELSFVKIAVIILDGNFYMILQPLELLVGMQDDEALVFAVKHNESGEEKYEIVLDDTVINAVFAEYDKLFDEAMASDGNED